LSRRGGFERRRIYRKSQAVWTAAVLTAAVWTAAAGAGLVAMLLLAAAMPATVFGAGSGAAAAVTPHTISVSIWQAALIALGYYLANSPWLFGLAFFTLYRPLVAGFFVGLILGDPAQGTLIGAAINIPYLGFISAGGNLPADASLAGWVGTTVALASSLDPTKAIPIAFGLGMLGTIIFYGRMAVDSVFAHWADARAEKADIGGVAFMNVVPGQLLLFVASFVPVFLLASTAHRPSRMSSTGCPSGPSTAWSSPAASCPRSASP
jgi:hypothetical protein